MRIVASAPGKLVLLGEYAVLEGAPSLVLAVNRRARVTLEPSPDDCWHIVSPTLQLRGRLRVAAGNAVWLDAGAPELDWVKVVLGGFARAAGLAPCVITLESDAFYFGDAGSRSKLGLGSSAALAVALLGALHAHAGLTAPSLNDVIVAHRALQHGRGSGIGVAAALLGGLVCFQLRRGAPWVERRTLPDALRWCSIYAGRPTSTRAMLDSVAHWQRRDPEAYARVMAKLAGISRRGADAIARGNAPVFLSSFAAYAKELVGFGLSVGADIVSSEHRELAALARALGCTYKSCGAGGGDAGIAFSTAEEPLKEFVRGVGEARYSIVDLAADPQGLQVAVNA